jgi:hypothetical protein
MRKLNLDTHLVQFRDERRQSKRRLDIQPAVIAGDRNHEFAPHKIKALISHKTP